MHIMTQEMRNIQTRQALGRMYQNTRFTTVPVTEEYDADIDWDWYALKYEKAYSPMRRDFALCTLTRVPCSAKTIWGVL